MITHPNPKINIGLDILRKRPDGFHDIESLFMPCFAVLDTLSIEESEKFKVEIVRVGKDGTDIPVEWDPRNDLTVKAYELLRKEFQLPPVSIRLEKNIPVGAGLGGGSADAAFALRMLSEMFNLYLPDEMLEIYAAELGSDCPFFVYNRPMFVSGRGDVLEPFDLPCGAGQSLTDGQNKFGFADMEIRLALPENISVSTKEAYSGVEPAVPELPLREALSRPVEQWRDCVKNDFEKSVFALYPSLAVLKDKMYEEGATYASMSGSGSAIYGIFVSE